MSEENKLIYLNISMTSFLNIVGIWNYTKSKEVKKKHAGEYISNISTDDRFPELKFKSLYKKTKSGLFLNTFEIIHFEIEGVFYKSQSGFDIDEFDMVDSYVIPQEDVKDESTPIENILLFLDKGEFHA